MVGAYYDAFSMSALFLSWQCLYNMLMISAVSKEASSAFDNVSFVDEPRD